MVKQQEWIKIYNLFKTGMSVPEISRRAGRSCPTIYRLINNGGPKLHPRKNIKKSKLNVKYKKYLDQKIKDGIANSKKLFQELSSLGYTGSYYSVNSYLKEKRIKIKRKRDKRSFRFETKPGEQAQIDWGSFGKITINNKINGLYCFVYILGYSRAMYIEFVVKQGLPVFEQCHINAFKKLGVPKTILYDNIKTVVLRKEKLPTGEKKIHYNPAFLDFARYYGFEVELSPPYWPRTKGKVEAGIKYIRNNFFQNIVSKQSFSSLEELNKMAGKWIDKVANSREHRTTGEKPFERWLKEKPYLKILNNLPFYSILPFFERNSTKDGMVQYKANFYSVPMKFSRRKLFVKESSKNGVGFIEIYHEDRAIAKHIMSLERGKWIIDDKHLEIDRSQIKGKRIKELQVPRQATSDVISRPLSYYDQLIS